MTCQAQIEPNRPLCIVAVDFGMIKAVARDYPEGKIHRGVYPSDEEASQEHSAFCLPPPQAFRVAPIPERMYAYYRGNVYSMQNAEFCPFEGVRL
jgi:hypothetical protein